jgi:uncharacterized membrane protein YedE/YeeE
MMNTSGMNSVHIVVVVAAAVVGAVVVVYWHNMYIYNVSYSGEDIS